MHGKEYYYRVTHRSYFRTQRNWSYRVCHYQLEKPDTVLHIIKFRLLLKPPCNSRQAGATTSKLIHPFPYYFLFQLALQHVDCKDLCSSCHFKEHMLKQPQKFPKCHEVGQNQAYTLPVYSCKNLLVSTKELYDTFQGQNKAIPWFIENNHPYWTHQKQLTTKKNQSL